MPADNGLLFSSAYGVPGSGGTGGNGADIACDIVDSGTGLHGSGSGKRTNGMTAAAPGLADEEADEGFWLAWDSMGVASPGGGVGKRAARRSRRGSRGTMTAVGRGT